MGMTSTEKIIAAHADRDRVKPGAFVEVRVDQTYSDDLGGPVTMDIFEQAGLEKVWDPDRYFVTSMVNMPAANIKAAEIGKRMREFCRKHGIKLYEFGEAGIHNTVVIEQGRALPGELIVGGNSHSCMAGAMGCFATGMGSTDVFGILATGRTWLRVPETMKIEYNGTPGPWVTGKDLILRTIGEIGVDGANYKAMEFTGSALSHLEMEERFSIANMVIEAGGKNGIMEPDQRTLAYADARGKRPYQVVRSDPDADYCQVVRIDVDNLEPQIALPFAPENIKPLSQVGELPVDQVYIGSCTNGWYSDLVTAAELIKGHKVHPDVRLIVIPSSQEIYQRCVEDGIAAIFTEAGAAFSTPTCGPCIGAHMGVLASGERCLSTSNRNFRGRQGSPEAETYLANPAVAAATAVVGRVAGPDEL